MVVLNGIPDCSFGGFLGTVTYVRCSPARGCHLSSEGDLIKSILIVDDSQTIRAAVRDFLQEQTGISVCGEAVDGVDALEKVRTLHPDLIIMDLSMPRMNGLRTARVLRATAVPVPIILFTMYSEELRSQDATEAGINAIVAKEDLSVLHHHIEKLLVTEA